MKKEFMAAALIFVALMMGMLTAAATSGCNAPAETASADRSPSSGSQDS